MGAKRVAFVAPYLPAPENTGGRIRMARLARALSGPFEVELFACGGAKEFASELRGEALSVYARRFVRGRKPSFRFAKGDPERVKSASPALLYWDVWRRHRAQPFDAVVVSHSYAMAVGEAARGAAIVLDEHNVESAYAVSTASARGASADGERDKLVEWERGCWRRADEVTCVSEDDAAIVRAVRASGVTVIDNGVNVGRVRYIAESARQSERDVVFVGLMSHGPNEEGAEFLATKVMPLVWREHEGARLVLCGRQPSERVRALASDRVMVTGTVENVGVYLDRARVMAVALQQGAGSSLKAVEALATGARVVSTPVGMRGIDGAKDGETHDEARDERAFAQAICRAFAGQSDDARGARARALAERYDWAVIGERFVSVVERATRARGGRR
ncbi:MAG: glycosyltransferase family 4 protein [Polyangiales bacterium]